MTDAETLVVMGQVAYGAVAFAVFMLIWQGPYTGRGHWTAIPHSLVIGALWPLAVLFFLLMPFLFGKNR